MKILAAILNFNSAAQTAAACASLKRGGNAAADVLIVDNGSGPYEVKRLHALVGEAEILSLEKNFGYAGGMNRAVEWAGEHNYDVTLLLNSDVVPAEDFVETLLAADGAGESILCPAICSDPAMTTLEGIGSTIDFNTGRHKLVGAGTSVESERGVNSEILPLGTAMWVPMKVWEQVGPLDDALFAYYEDADFGLRARRAGVAIVPLPTARLYHAGAAAFGSAAAPDRIYYALRNHLEIVRRYAPDSAPLLHHLRRWNIIFIDSIYFFGVARAKSPAAAKAIFQALSDFSARRLGPRRQGCSDVG